MKEVKFKYKFSSNYNPVYANGAYGGIGPKGEIIMNFYLERPPIPNAQTHLLSENGELGELTEQDPIDFDSTFIRYVDSGVILNIDNAKAIRDFLDQRIREFETAKEKLKE